LHEVRGCGGRIHSDERILLLAELEFVLIEEILAGSNLIESVAVENPLGADGKERTLDLSNGGADVAVGF
jgi:hypothetical protein